MILYARLILNLVLSPVFYIEEILTCNFSNELSCLFVSSWILVSITHLDFETCPELVLLPNHIDLSYKQ